jgi:hypothetical protein
MTKEEIKEAVTEILDLADEEGDFEKVFGIMQWLTAKKFAQGKIPEDEAWAIVEILREYKRPTKGEGVKKVDN